MTPKLTQQIKSASRECIAKLAYEHPATLFGLKDSALTLQSANQIIAATITKLIEPLEKELEKFTAGGLLDCHMICDQRDKAVQERDQLKQQLTQAEAALVQASH